MKLLLQIFFVFWIGSCSILYAQIEFGDNPTNLGVITEYGNDYVDIPIKNTSSKKVFIFRADVDKRFQIHYSSKTILPDSTVYLRVLFNPNKTGLIHEKIPIHFSCYEKPKVLKLTGMVEHLPNTTTISCPSFQQQNINTDLEFDFTVVVIDAATKQPIPESEINMIRNGVIAQTIRTKRKGSFTKKMELGYYYFIAKHPEYESNEMATYINRRNNKIIIPLKKRYIPEPENSSDETLIATEKTPPPTPPIPDMEFDEDEEITIVINDDPLPLDEEIEIGDLIPDIPDDPSVLNPPSEELIVEDDPYPDFSERDYKPNNIVFLVDVSSSMQFGGKMDLLKASMIELTGMLRPIDKITVVSYASKAQVVLETTYGNDKDSVINVIKSLEAKGFTAGAKGMQLAYTKTCEAMIADGNNIIIMATDGIFTQGDVNVNKLAKKYTKKGVTVSVVGIKNREMHVPAMQKLSTDGGGSYININTYGEAQESLVKEIKYRSKRLP